MAGGGIVVFVVVPSLGVVPLFNIIGSSPAWFVLKKILQNRSLLCNLESMTTIMKNHWNRDGEAQFYSISLRGITMIK